MQNRTDEEILTLLEQGKSTLLDFDSVEKATYIYKGDPTNTATKHYRVYPTTESTKQDIKTECSQHNHTEYHITPHSTYSFQEYLVVTIEIQPVDI